MAEYVKYPVFIKFVVKKYLRRYHSPFESKCIWDRTLELYDSFVEEAPDLGGSENNMSGNLYMALAVFAFYEASGRSVTPEMFKKLMSESLPKSVPIAGSLLDMNKAGVQEKLRERFEKYKILSDSKLDSGQWGNSWRVELNPHGREKGVAFDLTSCPLADFAQKHGYGDILPVLCQFDHVTAALMHAKLIREHTISEGGKYCDYWYVGDREKV